MNQVFNEDCVAVMKRYPDKHFDLAVVDPPYGIGRSGQTEKFTKNPKHKRKHFADKGWDTETPASDYWNELFRLFFLNWNTLAFSFFIRRSSSICFRLEFNLTNDLRAFEFWSFDFHLLDLRLCSFGCFNGLLYRLRSNRLLLNRFRLGFFGCATLGFGGTVKRI